MISVIMGLSRIDDYVPLAIQSILDQDFQGFEFIIVANGNESQKIESFISQKFSDSRIRVISASLGNLAHALNIAIENSSFSYIARMDGDDIAAPGRLSRSIAVLQEREVDVLGSDVVLIDGSGMRVGYRSGVRFNGRQHNIFFKNPICHPSVIMKKDALIRMRGYSGGFNSEDYDLWLRMTRAGLKWDNLNEPLLSYRLHSTASQGRILGYAESAGYVLREFLLNRSFVGLVAVFYSALKAIIKGKS